MKKFVSMVCVAIATLGLAATPTIAGPAFVINMGNSTDPLCFAPWASTDPDHPFVVLEGYGTLVQTDNGKGIAVWSCKLTRHTSEPVLVQDMFTGEYVLVTLASVEDTCAAFGLEPCQQGKHGVLLVGSEAGVCYLTAEITTTDWQRVITPSGADNVVCRFPARKEPK